MIRLIVKRRKTCRISGLDREWFETFDADLPEVERALGGGFGENGSLAGSVIGAEVITELPQDAGDGARVTDGYVRVRRDALLGLIHSALDAADIIDDVLAAREGEE